MNKLLTKTLEEATVLLSDKGFERDPGYRFLRFNEDFTRETACIFRTAGGGYSVWFDTPEALMEKDYEADEEVKTTELGADPVENVESVQA